MTLVILLAACRGHLHTVPLLLLTGINVSAAQLSVEQVVRDYDTSRRHLLVLGYNATLTTAVEAPRQPIRHFDQIKVASFPIRAYHLYACCAPSLFACSKAYCSRVMSALFSGAYPFCVVHGGRLRNSLSGTSHAV